MTSVHLRFPSPTPETMRLPLEVVSQIVDHLELDSAIEDRHRPRHLQWSCSERLGPRTITWLANANQTFYELCRPRLWKDLRLYDISSDDVDFLINKLLPRNSHLVQSLWVWISTELDSVPEPTDSEEEEEEEYCQPFLGIGLAPEAVAKILAMCANINTLHIGFHLDLNTCWWHEGHNLRPSFMRLINTSTLQNLRHLSLEAGDNIESMEDFLLGFLQQFPLLESFESDGVTTSREHTGYKDDYYEYEEIEESLGWHLSRLENLSALRLTRIYDVGDDWWMSSHPWPKLITTLRLIQCGNGLPITMYKIIKNIAPHLVELDLTVDAEETAGYVDGPAGLQPKHQFDLPFLKKLALGSHTAILLPAFGNCKALERLSPYYESLKDYICIRKLICRSTWPKLNWIYIPDPYDARFIYESGSSEMKTEEHLTTFCARVNITISSESLPWSW